MKLRTIAGAVMLPIIMIPLYLGNYFALAIMLVLSIFANYEYLRAFDLDHKLTKVIAFIANVGYYFMIYYTNETYILWFITGYFIVLMIVYATKYPKYEFKDLALMLTGFIYTNVLFSYVLLIRHSEFGIWYIWFVLVIPFMSDIFAYLVGRTIGKHKLTPKLSPNKTIEGAIGGVFGGILGSVLFGFIMYYFDAMDSLVYLSRLALLGGFGAVVAQIGDLVASGIKRTNNIKDFGNLIPGHGGILDRFDSVLMVSPIVYYLMLTVLDFIQ